MHARSDEVIEQVDGFAASRNVANWQLLLQKSLIRVSLDHYTAGRHEEERGVDTFTPTKDGLIWLARNGFNIAVAGRAMWGEDQAAQRAGYARLFAEHDIPIDANNSQDLVLFPEMDVCLTCFPVFWTDLCWKIPV